jgi:hypothetical protein
LVAWCLKMATKYTTEGHFKGLRLYVEARRKAHAFGVADNVGALEAVERILDHLAQARYGTVKTANVHKRDPAVEIGQLAIEARERGAFDQLKLDGSINSAFARA